MFYDTTLTYGELRNILVQIGLTRGQLVNWVQLSRRCATSVVTLKKICGAMEALFLIRRIPFHGGRHGEGFLMEDLGEWNHLCAGELGKGDLTKDPQAQIHFLWSQIRGHWNYQLRGYFEFFRYQTRHGAQVPLVIKSEGVCMGLLPISQSVPNLSERRIAKSFLGQFSNSKIVFLASGETREFDDRSAVLDALYLV